MRSQVPARTAFLITLALFPACAIAAGPASPNVQCIECHSKTTPSIVSDWKLRKHSQSDVGCVVCHGDRIRLTPKKPRTRRST